jgi:hypothetical protein
MYGDHSPAYGDQHPWHDPLAPQDAFNPRPDAELAMASGLAPGPQAFPFTPEGRRDYYAAVRSAANQQHVMQMHHMQAAHAERLDEEAVALRAAAHRRASFLLLSP